MYYFTKNCMLAQVLFYFFGSILIFSVGSKAQFEDLRCKCTCLSYPKYELPAQIFTGGVLSVNCNCLDVVVPVLNSSVMKKSDLEPYCLRCNCKYEVRSTKTMQVVVCIFIVLIGSLILYMIFMLAVDPFMMMVRGKKDPSLTSRGATFQSDFSQQTVDQPHGNSVFNKVSMVQSRWMKQVEEQRTNVFEKQDLLQ